MTDDLSKLRATLIGLTVTTVWRGHGSALFIEFGQLTPTIRHSGKSGQAQGDYGLMIEWNWRIEEGNTIRCGSWSDEDLWRPAFATLVGQRVSSLTTFGRLPELLLSLEGDTHVSSYMTAEGDPQWTIFDRRHSPACCYFSKLGRVCIE